MQPRPRPPLALALLLGLGSLLSSSLLARGRLVDADPRETHLKNLRQLTFEGENAEAYFSPDGKKLIFQARHGGAGCDRIYTMNTDGSEVKQVSSGKGATTCAYYLPQGRMVYASTMLGGFECPPRPDHRQGYVWALYPSYDIFTREANGFGLKRLTKAKGYDAEATVSPDGTKIIFTSMRTGDPELFVMDIDGSNKKQLTFEEGYDGGAFFTPDNQKIVWRRTSKMDEKALADYRRLRGQGLVRPSNMDLWVMNADGTGAKEVLANGSANFAPYGLPDGTGMLFSSNKGDPKGRNFDIYKVNYDGSGLERITYFEGFDAFPMFSPDGTQVVFASNRFQRHRGETNVFLADWAP